MLVLMTDRTTHHPDGTRLVWSPTSSLAKLANPAEFVYYEHIQQFGGERHWEPSTLFGTLYGFGRQVHTAAGLERAVAKTIQAARQLGLDDLPHEPWAGGLTEDGLLRALVWGGELCPPGELWSPDAMELELAVELPLQYRGVPMRLACRLDIVEQRRGVAVAIETKTTAGRMKPDKLQRYLYSPQFRTQLYALDQWCAGKAGREDRPAVARLEIEVCEQGKTYTNVYRRDVMPLDSSGFIKSVVAQIEWYLALRAAGLLDVNAFIDGRTPYWQRGWNGIELARLMTGPRREREKLVAAANSA